MCNSERKMMERKSEHYKETEIKTFQEIEAFFYLTLFYFY